MRSRRRISVFASMLLLASMASIASPSAAQAFEIPTAESNLYILDVSGSTNSVALWGQLRNSVISKLDQPFGNPISKSIPFKLPLDVSVTSISQNSQNSPIFPIVSKTDSNKVWGTVETVFPKIGGLRLERVTKQLFGESGVWPSQAQIFSETKIQAPTLASCRSSALAAMDTGSFLRAASVRSRTDLANVICDKLIGTAKSLKQVDDYFSTSPCDRGDMCSDVIGAIFRATSIAADLAAKPRGKLNGREVKNKLCIAIASDMIHESAGVTKTSVLNSRQVALTATTLEKARGLGAAAARAAGVKFSSDIETRVVMVGIGSGPKPIPLERNSFLLAYWEGFFTQAGVKQANQNQSINQACA